MEQSEPQCSAPSVARWRAYTSYAAARRHSPVGHGVPSDRLLATRRGQGCPRSRWPRDSRRPPDRAAPCGWRRLRWRAWRSRANRPKARRSVRQPADLPMLDAVYGRSCAALDVVLGVNRQRAQALPGFPRGYPEKLKGFEVTAVPCRSSDLAWPNLILLHVPLPGRAPYVHHRLAQSGPLESCTVTKG